MFNPGVTPLPLFDGKILLSPKQLEVTTYLVHGYTNKEVARCLNISHRTIEDHRKAVFDKLKVSNSVELTRLVYGVL